jgi:hypothetical protein
MIDKGLLDWMQNAVLGQSFDGGDLSAIFHHSQRETGIYPATIDQNGARATLSVVATLFGAGETEMNTQGVKQCGPGSKGQLSCLAIDVERDRSFCRRLKFLSGFAIR